VSVFACSMSFVTLTINEEKSVMSLSSYYVVCSIPLFIPGDSIQFILKCIRFKETLGLQWRLRGNCKTMRTFKTI